MEQFREGKRLNEEQIDVIFNMRTARLMTADEIAAELGILRKTVDKQLAKWPWYDMWWLICARQKKALAEKCPPSTMGGE